ncbi:MAG: PEP-CTERM sorting domain-containing protein [Verrucomicrobia bacterium]|nr:MAG: PEP-CTERM sorting domain-containing protein [Verrucomicrobiota bacterium]
MKLRKNTIALTAAACTLLITNTSYAAVVVTFEQVGNNVVATWSGIMNPGTFIGDDQFPFTFASGSSNSLLNISSANPFDTWSGTASPTILFGVPSSSSGGSFGFIGSSFYFNGVIDSQSNSSLVDFGTSGLFTMTWNSTNLSDIGAASFNNTLAWTSSAGGTNTISYTTIPEPTTSLLAACGLLAMLRRRR